MQRGRVVAVFAPKFGEGISKWETSQMPVLSAEL